MLAAESKHGANFQVLNLLLFHLAGRSVVDAEAELAFLAVDEQLVDIGDDLCTFHLPCSLLINHGSNVY